MDRPLAFTVPLSVAVLDVTLVAETVVTVGGNSTERLLSSLTIKAS